MELKKHYHRILNDAGEVMTEYVRDANGEPVIDPNTDKVKKRIKIMRDQADAPIVRGIEIKRMPTKGVHKFAPRLVDRGIAEGWITQTEAAITLHCITRGEVIFKIEAAPGRTCLECGERLEGIDTDPTGILARKHVATHDGKKAKPDPRWPGGYSVENYYLTTVEA